MSRNDRLADALSTLLGEYGDYNELQLSWLWDRGATSGKLNDAWHEYLDGQGISAGELNTRWYSWLTGLGYSGALPDMFYALWTDGGPVVPYDDIKVQHITTTILNATVDVTIEAVDQNKAFIFICNSKYLSNGYIGAACPNIDMGFRAFFYNNTTVRLHVPAGSSGTTSREVQLAVIEYVGAAGGPNEFKNIGNEDRSIGPTWTSWSAPTYTNRDDVVCIPSGTRSYWTTNIAPAGLGRYPMTYRASSPEFRDIQDHTSSTDHRLQYIEFTGSNWTIGHCNVVADQSATDTYDLTIYRWVYSPADTYSPPDWGNAWIIGFTTAGQYNTGVQGTISDYSAIYYPHPSTGYLVRFEHHSDHNATDTHSNAYVIYNPYMNVTRITDSGASTSNTIDISSAGITSVERSLISVSSNTSGTGQGLPRGCVNTRFTNNSDVDECTLTCGSSQATVEHRLQVIEFP